MKQTDDKWYWDTIEEFYILTLFDYLDKIHKYNEELQRIYTNADGDISLEEVAAVAAVYIFNNSQGDVSQTISQYNALKSIQRPHWPKIILDKSQSGFAVFDDTDNTLV